MPPRWARRCAGWGAATRPEAGIAAGRRHPTGGQGPRADHAHRRRPGALGRARRGRGGDPRASQVIRAEAADAAQMAELLRELGYANQAEDVTRRLSQMDARREWVLVATEDERLVGLAAYAVIPWFASDGAHCRVSAMVVAEGARSRGVGAA